MMVTGLGVSGIEERRAEAGIVLSMDAIEPARLRGAAATVGSGGNLVAVRRTDSTGFTNVASGIAINENGKSGVYIAGANFRAQIFGVVGTREMREVLSPKLGSY